MIKSAILQMYFGERGYCEQIPQSMKYRNLLDDFLDSERLLYNAIASSPETVTLYDKAKEALEQVNIESAQNHFSEGFRFGLLMGLDVAQTDNG